MEKLHMVIVRGDAKSWGIETYITEATATDWRADGLDVEEVVNTIPAWVVGAGLTRPWCWLQDLLNFRWCR